MRRKNNNKQNRINESLSVVCLCESYYISHFVLRTSIIYLFGCKRDLTSLLLIVKTHAYTYTRNWTVYIYWLDCDVLRSADCTTHKQANLAHFNCTLCVSTFVISHKCFDASIFFNFYSLFDKHVYVCFLVCLIKWSVIRASNSEPIYLMSIFVLCTHVFYTFE